MPPGKLREILSYPHGNTFSEADLAGALSRVGLQRMVPMLDTEARWERELSDDDERLLAFARILLHKPRWIVMDEVLEAMEPQCLRRVLAILQDDLEDATVVSIGRPVPERNLFSRRLQLIKEPRPSERLSTRPDKSLEGTPA